MRNLSRNSLSSWMPPQAPALQGLAPSSAARGAHRLHSLGNRRLSLGKPHDANKKLRLAFTPTWSGHPGRLCFGIASCAPANESVFDAPRKLKQNLSVG